MSSLLTRRRLLAVSPAAIAFVAAPAIVRASTIFGYEHELVDLMDSHYGIGMWSFRTGPNTGTDIGPALQDGINQLHLLPNQSGTIKLGPFNWNLATSGIDFAGIQVEGVTSVRSAVVFQNANGQAFSFKGSSGGGLKHVAIMLEDGIGDSNSMALFLYGNSVTQPDQTQFEDLYITSVGGTSYWWDCIHVDGQNRASPGGIRVVTWKDIVCFKARNIGFLLGSVYRHTLENVSCYLGKGSYPNSMFIAGTPTVMSHSVWGSSIDANLTIYQSDGVWINGVVRVP